MTELKRHLNLPKLTFYGVGDILGAGIYALVGKVAWEAGGLAWFAFLFAGLSILPTALSYAELTSRYPKSGGVSVFAGRAFRRHSIPFVVGFIVLMSGLVSSAAVANAFHGYLSTLWEVPRGLAIVFFLSFLTFINWRGIAESSNFNILCVLAEAGGLLLIIAFGWGHWGEGNFLVGRGGEGFLSRETLEGIGAASILAFYAAVGFEDICNVSEEVIDPEKTVPKAILLAVSISSLIYIGIALTVVSVVSIPELGESKAPLALVASKIIPFFSPKVIATLALFSLTNTALANMIMASRLLYGMSREGWIFRSFSLVSSRRQTPVVAVITVFFLTLVLALSGSLKILGQTTSVIMLSMFIIVHLSLLVIRIRGDKPDSETRLFRIPLVVPFLGILISAFMITQAPHEAYLRVGILFGIGFLLSLSMRRFMF
ncbi:MAG: amino acid permease [Deltaproteobacteria bacterium]|nr:amino acid permease [Deltaproteobacteria bacterium]